MTLTSFSDSTDNRPNQTGNVGVDESGFSHPYGQAYHPAVAQYPTSSHAFEVATPSPGFPLQNNLIPNAPGELGPGYDYEAMVNMQGMAGSL